MNRHILHCILLFLAVMGAWQVKDMPTFKVPLQAARRVAVESTKQNQLEFVHIPKTGTWRAPFF